MSLTPLHTRIISLRFVWGAPDSLIIDGRVMDVRKRGIMPMGGRLRSPGLIHDMGVRVELEYPSLRIRGVEPVMSTVPFVPSTITQGEGCRDRMPDVQRLCGASLREDWGAILTQEMGGVLGCFHIFTLLRLMGPTVEAVVNREQSLRPGNGAIAGSAMFSRNIIMDCLKGEGLWISARGVLSDVYYQPGTTALPPEGGAEETFEAAAELEIEVPRMTLLAASGRVRRSGSSIDSLGAWESVPRLGDLVGLAVVKGYTAEVQRICASDRALEPVRHLLFMLAPTIQQSMASMAEELEMGRPRPQGPHPVTNSCHMFRANGPLVTSTGQLRILT